MALMLAGERGTMDSLRYQANVVVEAADRGIRYVALMLAKGSTAPSVSETAVGEDGVWH